MNGKEVQATLTDQFFGTFTYVVENGKPDYYTVEVGGRFFDVVSIDVVCGLDGGLQEVLELENGEFLQGRTLRSSQT